MGEYAEDLINGSEQTDLYVKKSNVLPSKGSNFEVSIIHLKTGVTHWTGSVVADSKRDAQRQFRIKYADIRSKYSYEYALGIKLLK